MRPSPAGTILLAAGPRDAAAADALLADDPRASDLLVLRLVRRDGAAPALNFALLTTGESVTTIWHYIFGMANQKLMEAGMFAEPYATGRRHPGAIGVVNALGP